MCYAISTAPPSVTSTTAREFDLRLRHAIGVRQGFELEGRALSQAVLPTTRAGVGLRSAQELAPIAFLSSHARAAQHLADIDFSNTPTTIELASCLDTIKRALPETTFKSLLPSSASTFHFHFRQHSANHLQHSLTTAFERQAFDRLLNTGSLQDQARLKAAIAPKASLWITAAPSTPDTCLDDFTMRLSIRRLLGLPPSDVMPVHCPFCTLPNGDLQLHPWHPISCPRIAGTLATRRHDHAIVDNLTRWVTKLGGYATKPTKRDALRLGGEDVIPDFDMQIGPSRFLGDVTVWDPTAPSHVVKAATQPLAVAAEAEKNKHDKYREHLRRLRPRPIFVPFAVESYGGIGNEASNFIKQLIAQAAGLRTVWQPSEVVHNIYWSIACAIQRWNASIMRKALHSH